MFDFQEYREHCRLYMNAEEIRDRAIMNLEHKGIFVDYKYKTLTIKNSLTTAEMKDIENEFGVKFKTGGRDVVKFRFDEEINDKDIQNLDMQNIRESMDITKNLYEDYFEKTLDSMYQDCKINNEYIRIELTRYFWGFFIKGPASICDDGFSLDKIIEIETVTDSVFKNYDTTLGYEFHFR